MIPGQTLTPYGSWQKHICPTKEIYGLHIMTAVENHTAINMRGGQGWGTTWHRKANPKEHTRRRWGLFPNYSLYPLIVLILYLYRIVFKLLHSFTVSSWDTQSDHAISGMPLHHTIGLFLNLVLYVGVEWSTSASVSCGVNKLCKYLNTIFNLCNLAISSNLRALVFLK